MIGVFESTLDFGVDFPEVCNDKIQVFILLLNALDFHVLFSYFVLEFEYLCFLVVGFRSQEEASLVVL